VSRRFPTCIRLMCRQCRLIRFVSNRSAKTREEINCGISVTHDSIVNRQVNMSSKSDEHVEFDWERADDQRMTSLFSCRTSRWQCVCRTLDEWNTFIECFREKCSKRRAPIKDRQLLERLLTLNADLPNLYMRKERDRQRRWTSYEPKRASTRLEVKRQQRLEFEEITQEHKARQDKFLEFKRRQEQTIVKEKERLERYERVRRREGEIRRWNDCVDCLAF
jgi:hypothetical protein